MKKTPWAFILILMTTLLIAYQNCSPSKLKIEYKNSSSEVAPTPVQQDTELPAVNFFTEPPPELICGEDGYEFLMDQYITQHCAACHNTNGFAPGRFAQPSDISGSYLAARRADEDRFIKGVLEGTFCGPDCILDPEGEVFLGIKEWLDNKSCP